MMIATGYQQGSAELREALSRFQLDGATLVEVLSYRMLTPDSFLWELRMTDGRYFLYAEDAVTDFVHVAARLIDATGITEGYFVQVQAPANSDILSRFSAARPGTDEVFLYKVQDTLRG